MVYLLTHRENFERMLRECGRKLHVDDEPGENGSTIFEVSQGFHEGSATFEFDREGKLIGVGGSDEGRFP